MGSDRDLVRCVGCCFLVCGFVFVGWVVWLWFCVGVVALHDLSHSFRLHLSQ